MHIRSLFCSFMICVWFALPAVPIRCEPAAGGTGEITGCVSGPNGARLPGVSVSLHSRDTNDEVQLITSSGGIYRASGLKSGMYELKAELERFEPKTIGNVFLEKGGIKNVNFELEIAALHITTTVIGISPQDSFEAAQARESSARDVGEALAQNAGLWKLRKGGIASDVVMRGLQGEDINVLIDGQRVFGACPNHMDPPAFHVDFAEVDRIEIGKGPFDIKNQGSLGGTINIITAQPEQGFHARGNLSLGSFGYVNPSATASYSRNGYSILGGYSYRTSSPYTDGAGKRFTDYANFRSSFSDSSAFDIDSVWAKLSASPFSGHLMQIAYARQAADHLLYPYLLMDGIYDNTDRANFSYRIGDLSGALKSIRVQTYFTRVRHWMTDEYRTSSLDMPRAYSMGTFASTRALGGKLEAGFGGISIGVEGYLRDWNAATEMAGRAYKPQNSIPDVTSTMVGAYASITRTLREGLNLDLGARVDRAESTASTSKADTDLYFAYNGTRSVAAIDAFPSGSVRLSYGNGIGVEISGGVGHTVRIPDPRERYFALRRMGSDWVGNPDLAPSRNTGADLAASFHRNGFLLSSSFYFNRISNFIAVHAQTKVNMIPGVMNAGSRSYQNVNARMYGGEMQLVYLLTHRIFLSSGLSFVRGTQGVNPQEGMLSRNMAEIPPLTSHAGIRYDIGKIAAEFEGVFTARQDRVNSDLGERPTPGYGIANLTLSGNLKHIALRVGMNNLFNRDYIEYLSFQRDPFRSGTRVHEPGRNFFVNVSVR